MKFDFNKIKNIANDVSKEVVNVVGDKYLEIKANNNFNEGKYGDVIKTANEILKIDKFNYNITILKAKSLMKQKRYDEAVDVFIDALVIDKTKLEPLLFIAEINLLQSKYDDAIDIYQSVLKKDSKNIPALTGLIKPYFLKEDYGNVNKYCDIIQTLDADELKAHDYYYWGISLMEVGSLKDSKSKLEYAKKLNCEMDVDKEINSITKKECDSLIKNAKYEFNNEEYKKVDELFMKAFYLKESNLSADDYYIWGMAQEKLGNNEQAYLYFKKANEKQPSDKFNKKVKYYDSKIKEEIESLKSNAIECFESGEYKCANDYFEKASRKRANILNADDNYMWAVSLMKLNRRNDSINKFKKANRLNPNKYSKNQYDYEIINCAGPALLMKEAKINFNKEEYPSALKFINKSIELSSSNADAYMLKGEILLLTDDYDGSKICFKKARELNYKLTFDKIINIAQDYYTNKKYNLALNYIDVVTECDLKNEKAWVLKGDILTALQNFKESDNCYDKALEINPNNDRAKKGKGINDFADSVTNPERSGFWLNMGMHELVDGNYEIAHNALVKAIEIDPESSLAFQQLGIVYHNIKEYNQALIAFDKSLELDSNDDKTWFHKGNTMFWSGNFYKAIECFDKAIELNPDECDDAYAIKGMALVKLNDIDLANRCFITALAKNPTNKYALAGMKYMPDIWNLEVTPIDNIAAAQANVDPVWFAKIKFIKEMVDQLRDKGVKINLEYDKSMDSMLTHDSKEYFFHHDELEGALVYVNLLWGEYFN